MVKYHVGEKMWLEWELKHTKSGVDYEKRQTNLSGARIPYL